jgi:sensor histidine kinase regulating citrate/malate metabolism
MSDALVLILKDLLKNALKNTDEQNPHVEVSIIEQDKNILLEIINNQAIAEEFSDWFNEKSDIEPQISKSTKVGLRIIKKWVKILNIQAELLPDKKQNNTYARVIIPKKINYGQTN